MPLACLHGCGLIARERRGREVRYRVQRPEAAALIASACAVWEITRGGESCPCDRCMEEVSHEPMSVPGLLPV
jgi:hypothetical protein